MSICENCKTLDICTVVDGNKEACWFFSPTEKHRIEQSKEYAIGYEQGRTDERAKCEEHRIEVENLVQELNSRVSELESAVAFLLNN